jgi:hypothetical protein
VKALRGFAESVNQALIKDLGIDSRRKPNCLEPIKA